MWVDAMEINMELQFSKQCVYNYDSGQEIKSGSNQSN